jgi:hypothetical protein
LSGAQIAYWYFSSSTPFGPLWRIPIETTASAKKFVNIEMRYNTERLHPKFTSFENNSLVGSIVGPQLRWCCIDRLS